MIRALKAKAWRGVSLRPAAFGAVPSSRLIDYVDLPVTDRVAASLVRLPISAAFTDAECDDVVTACVKVFQRLLPPESQPCPCPPATSATSRLRPARDASRADVLNAQLHHNGSALGGVAGRDVPALFYDFKSRRMDARRRQRGLRPANIDREDHWSWRVRA